MCEKKWYIGLEVNSEKLNHEWVLNLWQKMLRNGKIMKNEIFWPPICKRLLLSKCGKNISLESWFNIRKYYCLLLLMFYGRIDGTREIVICSSLKFNGDFIQIHLTYCKHNKFCQFWHFAVCKTIRFSNLWVFSMVSRFSFTLHISKYTYLTYSEQRC